VQEAPRAKNGLMGFRYGLFSRVGWKPYMYVSIPSLQRSGAPGFRTPRGLSAQPFSIRVSFLPVTPLLQSLILESVLRARTRDIINLSLPSPTLFIWCLGADGRTWHMESQELGPWVQTLVSDGLHLPI
jgi:hypothetical protein